MRIVRIPGLIAPSASEGISVFVWLSFFGLLCVISLAHESLLPAKFLLDKEVILDRMRHVGRLTPFGDSFDNLAWVLKALGLGVPMASFLGFALSAGGLMMAIRVSGAHTLTPLEFCLFVFWAVAQTAYIGLPSKEIVVSLVVLAAFIWRNSRLLLPVFFGSLVLVVIFFRLYWAIVAVSTLGLYLAPRLFRRGGALMLFAALLFFCAAVLFKLFYGESLDFARRMANDFRYIGEVGSMIVPPLPGGGMVIDVINALLILGTFVLPIPLILSGVVTQVAGGVGIFLTFAVFFRRYFRNLALFDAGRFEKLCFCFVISFLATQAIFEPDYGSFLRHLSPMSPMLIYLMVWARVQRTHAAMLAAIEARRAAMASGQDS